MLALGVVGTMMTAVRSAAVAHREGFAEALATEWTRTGVPSEWDREGSGAARGGSSIRRRERTFPPEVEVRAQGLPGASRAATSTTSRRGHTYAAQLWNVYGGTAPRGGFTISLKN